MIIRLLSQHEFYVIFIPVAEFGMECLCAFRSIGADEGRLHQGDRTMLDVIFVGLTIILFAAMAAYAVACDRL